LLVDHVSQGMNTRHRSGHARRAELTHHLGWMRHGLNMGARVREASFGLALLVGCSRCLPILGSTSVPIAPMEPPFLPGPAGLLNTAQLLASQHRAGACADACELQPQPVAVTRERRLQAGTICAAASPLPAGKGPPAERSTAEEGLNAAQTAFGIRLRSCRPLQSPRDACATARPAPSPAWKTVGTTTPGSPACWVR